jgi:hypothetical protein
MFPQLLVFGLVLIGIGVATLLSVRGKKDDDTIMMSTTKGISTFPFPVKFARIEWKILIPIGVILALVSLFISG